MINDELLKSYMDQLAKDQQNYRDDMRAIRDDMRAMQARMDAQQVRTDERVEAMQARSDERMEAIKRDIRANIWPAIVVATAVVGIIVTVLR